MLIIYPPIGICSITDDSYCIPPPKLLAGENIADNYMAIGLVAEGTLPGSFKITLAKKMLLNTLL